VPIKCELVSTDLVRRNGQRLVLLRIDNDARSRSVVVGWRIGGHAESMRLTVPHGPSTHWISFPAVAAAGSIRLEIDGQVLRVRIRASRTWTIHLVNHTHTDIGYTDYQPSIRRDFYRFLLEAMALVEQTKTFPEPARFRWSIETSYHLRNFCRFASRPQLRELIGHLRRGTIDVAANFLQMTDLPNTDQVIRSFHFIRDFARRYRIPLGAAMACDINGLPWVYPAALHDLGVCNLAMAINDDSARCPLKRPTPLWWESPDGKRVLVWHGEQYHLGNHFGIERGVEDCMAGVAEYLSHLAAQGYPYNHVLLQVSGTYADNSPPAVGPCLTARDWNRRFANPAMRLDTMSRWFAQVRRMLSDDVPVYRGHWPDYWAHGLGSAADEIRYARETQHLLSAAGVAATYVSATDRSWEFPAATLERAYNEAELANEHTWGAYCSVSEPERDWSKIQWQYKRDPFYRARMDSELALSAALERIGRAALRGLPGVVVYNPLAWTRSGVVELDSVYRPLPGYVVERLVDARTRRTVPYWRKYQYGTLLELRIPIRDVPATGYSVLPVVKRAAPKLLEWASANAPPNVMENRYYRIRVAARTGQLQSIYDKRLRLELVGNNKAFPFGRIIQEQLPGPEARGWVNRRDRKALFNARAFRRSAATAKTLRRAGLPGCFQEITFSGACRGLTRLTTTIRLHEREKRIDLIWRLALDDHPDPQAAYVPFSFAGSRPRIWLEVPGAAMQPGVDQIPTTCCDFYTVQNFVRIEAGRAAMTLVPRDTPLVQSNEISTFHFRRKLPRFNGTVVAWLFNNYWHTNFPTRQPGEHLFRFSITSGPARLHGMADSYRFAYHVANPLRARFLPESHSHRRDRSKRRAASGSFVAIEPENVLLLSSAPATGGRGYVLRLQETAGQRTRAVLRFAELKPRQASVTDLYEGNPRPAATRGRTVRVVLAPRELATVKLVF